MGDSNVQTPLNAVIHSHDEGRDVTVLVTGYGVRFDILTLLSSFQLGLRIAQYAVQDIVLQSLIIDTSAFPQSSPSQPLWLHHCNLTRLYPGDINDSQHTHPETSTSDKSGLPDCP